MTNYDGVLASNSFRAHTLPVPTDPFVCIILSLSPASPKQSLPSAAPALPTFPFHFVFGKTCNNHHIIGTHHCYSQGPLAETDKRVAVAQKAAFRETRLYMTKNETNQSTLRGLLSK